MRAPVPFPVQIASLERAIALAHPRTDLHAGLVAALESLEAFQRSRMSAAEALERMSAAEAGVRVRGAG